MPLVKPLPPPPNAQDIGDAKGTPVKVSWTWGDWFFRLTEKLKELTILPTLGNANQFLTVNTAATDLEYKTLQGTANEATVTYGAGLATISLTGPHAFTTQTAHGLLIGQGTSPITAAAVMSDGQLVVGQSSADPLPKTVSGDATLAASGALTFATVNSSPGTYGDSTHVAQVTVNGKGLSTTISSIAISYPVTSVFGQTGAIANLSGDVSTSGSSATTLATVNATAGTFGSATQVSQVTVNAKGLVTAAANVTISGTSPGGAAGGDLSGTYPNPTVAKINGATLGTTTATSARILVADGSAWQSVAASGDLTLSSAGVATLATVVSASTNTKITYNAKGLVTAGTAATLASSDFANQGTTTTVLHGNAAGNPSFAAVSLTADISGTLAATNGGTGFASYVVGDLLYASTTTALSKLADVAAGSFLRSGGVSTAPAWSTTVWTNSATTGDLLYASASNTYSNLADVAAGSYLRSGGVSTAPLWSTTTLPNSATTGDLLYASASNIYSNLADIATGNALISGGVSTAPSWGKIGLTTHVSGTLPVANGGTSLATLTAHSLYVGSGTSAPTALGSATNGQIPIGSTGADPVLATITAGTGISVTNAAGSITIAQSAGTTSTYTPVLTFGGASTGITYSSQVGHYQQIGNIAFVQGAIRLTSKGSATGAASITLPLTAIAGSDFDSVASVRGNNFSAGTVTQFMATVSQGSTTLSPEKYSAGSNSTLTDTDFTNSSVIFWFASYFVA